MLEVLALCGFAAGPQDGRLSPYAQVYYACEGNGEASLKALLSTHLMIASTQFKWEAFVRPHCMKLLCCYVAHTLLTGTAMVTATRAHEKSMVFDGSPRHWNMADFLVLGVLLTNSLVLRREVNQIWMNSVHSDGCCSAVWRHLVNGWNLCDLTGVMAVYCACASYLGFLGDQSTVETIGSIAVLLNAFSILPLLLPFRTTGLLVQTMIGMANDDDIRGYMIVTSVLLYGFSMAFCVSMPDEFGPATGILSSFEAMIGAFHLSNYNGNAETLTFFLVFSFVMVIVMLNLLIAVMSDVYTDSKDHIQSLLPLQRVQLIVDCEARMSDADRRNAAYFPEFLQVLRPVENVEDAADEWAGVSGQVSAVRDEVGAVKRESRQMMQKVDALAAEMKEMRTNQEMVMEQLRSMAMQKVDPLLY